MAEETERSADAETKDVAQFVDARGLRAAVDYRRAALALDEALQSGFDPADDHQRVSEPLPRGTMLLMPSGDGTYAGIKVLTVAPDNPGRGLDLIQGVYLLFDGDTLALRRVIDGAALTDLRTPATSMMAITPALGRFQRPLRAVVFGAGHQGRSHAQALRQIVADRPGVESIVAVVRNPQRVDPGGDFSRVVEAGSSQAEVCLADADVVLCATPAAEPLFDSSLLRDDVVVAAVGSHSPDARELDGKLMARADVVVEDRATAMRECGDLVLAMAEGHLAAADLHTIADVVNGRTAVDPTKPYVFKGSGMSWQDLAVAAAYEAGRPTQ